jgi:hypothetical protein
MSVTTLATFSWVKDYVEAIGVLFGVAVAGVFVIVVVHHLLKRDAVLGNRARAVVRGVSALSGFWASMSFLLWAIRRTFQDDPGRPDLYLWVLGGSLLAGLWARKK